MSRRPRWLVFWGFWVAWGVAGLIMLIPWGIGNLPFQTAQGAILGLGRLAGFVLTLCVLLQLSLQSRLPGVEKAFGLTRLLKIHRYNGYVIFYVLLAHPTLLVIGYNLSGHAGLWAQFLDFIANYHDVLRAVIAAGLLLLVVAMSISMVRLRLPYELWYIVHLSVYIAVLLSFGHQLHNGQEFVGHPWLSAYWYLLYATVGGLIAWFRFLKPVLNLLDHEFKVERIVDEAPTIHSVYISGRNLDQLGIVPGQFYIWRFLDANRWWQAHPFSVSMVPKSNQLRLTFKEVGGFTRGLKGLRPGTWVLPEGSHGTFTLDEAHGSNPVFIAGGIGITPLRAMIEALPEDQKADLIYAARDESDVVFKNEFAAFSHKLKANYVYENISGRLTPERIKSLVPDIAMRDVFLCGPPAMMNAVTQMLVSIGADPDRVHTERFALNG